MLDGKAGCLVFAVCASAERDETNAINKISVVLFIARLRGFDSGPAIRWLMGEFLQYERDDCFQNYWSGTLDSSLL